MSIATGSAIQTGKTGRSREATVPLVSSHTADCDGIAWVSLLTGETWRTLGTRGTWGSNDTRCSWISSVSFETWAARRSRESGLSCRSWGSWDATGSTKAVHTGVALFTFLARPSLVTSFSLHTGTPGLSSDAVLSCCGKAWRSGETRLTLSTRTPRTSRRTWQRQPWSAGISLLTSLSWEAWSSRQTTTTGSWKSWLSWRSC